MRRVGKKNRNLVVCPHNKQFKDLVVCAACCDKFCSQYIEGIKLVELQKYVEEHPEYKIIGVIMAGQKTAPSPKKLFWVIDSDKKVREVEEKEIINNPQAYLNMEIWDRPPYKYEVIIALKRVKA
ncbi:MAG: hypothetical protein K9M99_04200 [Candidatus Cloacimonetes bacterium]|nr:hypothetical protein [Candidatus Cloacimonadota bacterium]